MTAVRVRGKAIRLVWTPPDLVTPPSDATIPTVGELLTALQALPAMRIPHYAFAYVALADADPLVPEYVRLTRAYGLSLEFTTEAQINAIIPICKAVNAADPRLLPVTLSLNYAPYANKTRFPGWDPTTSGTAETDYVTARLVTVKGWIDAANTANSCNIQVAAVLFDTEGFDWQDDEVGHAAWNTALDAKYDAVYNVARAAYPAASIQWFDRGVEETDVSATRSAFVPSITGWMTPHGFTGNELADAHSATIYIVPEQAIMRETMRRTLAFAELAGSSSVTPWIALGAGYHRFDPPETFHTWDDDWDFDTAYSIALGEEINRGWHGLDAEHYAPWSAARMAVFYPQAFQAATPAWGKHFLAYCRGAAGVYAVTGYKILRQQMLNGAALESLRAICPNTGRAAPYYEDGAFEEGWDYNYEVRAINAEGESVSSGGVVASPSGAIAEGSRMHAAGVPWG